MLSEWSKFSCNFIVILLIIDTFSCISSILQLCILVAGAVGGRFDHEMGNINVLYRYSDLRMILLSDDCLIHLLPKNKRHEIHILSSVEGPHCGLIPIGSSSTTTTTTGLRWNLSKFFHWYLEFYKFLFILTWLNKLLLFFPQMIQRWNLED